MTEKSHTSLELENLLATAWGRSFLRRLLFEHTQVLTSPHHPDPQAASYNMGRHAIGLLVLGEVLEADPSALATLLKEEKTDVQELE